MAVQLVITVRYRYTPVMHSIKDGDLPQSSTRLQLIINALFSVPLLRAVLD
jgi:hypothetical protein